MAELLKYSLVCFGWYEETIGGRICWMALSLTLASALSTLLVFKVRGVRTRHIRRVLLVVEVLQLSFLVVRLLL
jgi:hypothetical protein